MSGLARAIEEGRIDPHAIVAIIGKTEGNGCVNDFSRGLATLALGRFLMEKAPTTAANACLVMSGGTEGALAPHFSVFEVRETAAADGRGRAGAALAVGRVAARLPSRRNISAVRRRFGLVADGVAAAMRDAGIERAEDVHFVQIKCPLLTAARIAEAEARGAATATRDTLKSMGLSRGASALGVALALGECRPDLDFDAVIGRDFRVFSSARLHLRGRRARGP